MTADDLRSAQSAAARVAGSAGLGDIRLRSTACESHRVPAGEVLSYDQHLSVTAERTGEQSWAVSVSCTIEVEGNEQGSEQARPVCRLAFVFDVLYEWPESLADEFPADSELDAFARTSGMLTAFPYVREYVAETTVRLGLPSLVLPPFRLPSPWHADGSHALEDNDD